MRRDQAQAIEILQAGLDVVGYHEGGNSMVPLIRSHQPVTLSPVVAIKDLKRGDIVFCKVNGRIYLHKVLAVKDNQVQIGNNRGGVNGWTSTVYGKVTQVHAKQS